MIRHLIALTVCMGIAATARADIDDECGHCDSIADWFEKLGCVQRCLDTLDPVAPWENPDENGSRDWNRPPPPPGPPACRDFDTGTLSQGARALFGFACNNNLTYDRSLRYKVLKLKDYLKDEDGTVVVIRTGYEVALYKRLKNRLVNREVYPRLPIEDLFAETIYAMMEVQRGDDATVPIKINIPDVLLTAHNVTRLLARPEQWTLNPRWPDSGQHRPTHDLAWPILLDLTGQQSVDSYPTIPHYFRWRNVLPQDITEAFYGSPGVFQYFGAANRADDGYPPSHWNGGIHYYYWVGALGEWMGDALSFGLYGFYGAEWAKFTEYLKKGVAGYERASVQIGLGFDPGATLGNNVYNALAEIRFAYPAMVPN